MYPPPLREHQGTTKEYTADTHSMVEARLLLQVFEQWGDGSLKFSRVLLVSCAQRMDRVRARERHRQDSVALLLVDTQNSPGHGPGQLA